MRTIVFMTAIVFSLACGSTRKTSSTQLNGMWIPVAQQMSGKELPSAAFAKQALIIHDSTYTFTAESVDKGILKYSSGKMDIYGKEGVNTGKHFTAIYKMENGQLLICYNLAGDAYPQEFETKSNPTLFLSTYKKG